MKTAKPNQVAPDREYTLSGPTEVDGAVLSVAPEDAKLPKSKVGGLADVNGAAPTEIAKLGKPVKQASPSLGFLHKLFQCEEVASFMVASAGKNHHFKVHRAPDATHVGVTHYFFDSDSLLSLDGKGQAEVYHSDPDDRPFETDAKRYALFCLAVAEALRLGLFGPIRVLHLHDWTTAFLLMLLRFHDDYRHLSKIKTVFTIHNLALQGIRPLRGHHSSLESFFDPNRFHYSPEALTDPNHRDCVNPMAAGIRLADRVHVVSPTYSEEIQRPSSKPAFVGGESLEGDLLRAKQEGRLYGILNGCDYSSNGSLPRLAFKSLIEVLRTWVLIWEFGNPLLSSTYAKLTRLLVSRPPRTIIACVSRIVEQKCLLMVSPGSKGRLGLDGLLDQLRAKDALLVVLGKGESKLEAQLHRLAEKHPNFIFLNGYSEDCAEALLSSADIFLNSASFEPCGITQLVAMRNGIPCVVHATGGLKDTVTHGVTGFTFSGQSLEVQVEQFVATTLEAVLVHQQEPARWSQLRRNAAEARFPWSETARRYIELLYN